MKLSSFIKNERLHYLLIVIFSLMAILPFVVATFYIHPNADDLYFSAIIKELGTFGFVKHFYFTWSGRYFSNFLLGIPKAHIIDSIYLYTLVPIIFIVSNGIIIFKLLNLFFKHILEKWKIISLSVFILAFFITSLSEVYSAIFWNCASYYMIWNVFFIWLIIELSKYLLNNHIIKSFHFFTLVILTFLICGLSEIHIISLIISFCAIILFHYQQHKIIKYDFIILLTIVCVGAYINMFSPGSVLRMNESHLDDPAPKFIGSAIRALYDLIILQLAPLLYSGYFVILIFVLLKGGIIIKNSEKFKKFFNINPIFTLFVVIFTFYLHHAMSLYGAGYVLQGRIINVTNLLLLFSLGFVVMNAIAYYDFKFNFNPSVVITSFIFLSFLINFSSNSRIVSRDVISHFPTFNTEMNERYKTITQAKHEGKKEVRIKRISHALKSLDTSIDYDKNYTYYNTTKYCRDATTFFKIDVKIIDDQYDITLLE